MSANLSPQDEAILYEFYRVLYPLNEREIKRIEAFELDEELDKYMNDDKFILADKDRNISRPKSSSRTNSRRKSELDPDEDIDAYLEYASLFTEDPSRPLEPKEQHKPIIKNGKTYVNLYPWQEEHAAFCRERLGVQAGILDTSAPGTGKTYLAIYLAQYFGFKMFIICPANLVDNWKRAASQYSVEVVDVISYEKIRRRKDNKYLDLISVPSMRDASELKELFRVKPHVRDMLLKEKIMVCVDEVHHCKNEDTLQSLAVQAFLEPVNFPQKFKAPGTLSRWYLMTGTPYTLPRLAIQYLKLMGIAPYGDLYEYNTSTKEYIQDVPALEYLYARIRAMDDPKATDIKNRTLIKFNKESFLLYCHQVFREIVKKTFQSSMPKPRSGFNVYRYNSYFDVSAEDRNLAIVAMRRLVHMFTDLESGKNFLAGFTETIMDVHMAKVDCTARNVRDIINSTRKDKVIVFTTYDNSTEALVNKLQNLNPIVVTGATYKKDRTALFDKFNDDVKSRILIVKMYIGGEGLDLHDRVGDAPRHLFIWPTYDLINIQQGVNRIDRVGRRSPIGIYLVYIDRIGDSESRMYNSLYQKSLMLRETLIGPSSNVVLPGDFTKYRESENPKYKVFDWSKLPY